MKAAARAVGLALLCACSPGGAVDVADRSHDVVRPPGSADPPEGYEYVIKKPHGTLALAEGRGLDRDVARRASERLAEGMERCLASLEKGAPIVPGAVRVVAPIDAAGAVGQPLVKVSAGGDAAATALLCLVAPVKMMAFPTGGDAGARGIAFEATWP